MYNPNIHHRKSIRLKNYDYSKPGVYFITICTNNREQIFGEINYGEMNLNQYGIIIEQHLTNLQNHYSYIELDTFIIMPDHLHAIIKSNHLDERRPLSEIIRGFKSFSAQQINKMRQTNGMPFWQRNYYEHIIRNHNELNKIREYITNNPLGWDDEHRGENNGYKSIKN